MSMILVEWTGEKQWFKAGPMTHYLMRAGKQVYVPEELFDSEVMVKVDGSASKSVSAGDDVAVEQELAVESGVDESSGDVEDSGDEESDSEKGSEADGSEEETEDPDVDIESMSRVELHAYARAQGVNPLGKTMEEIRKELGAE